MEVGMGRKFIYFDPNMTIFLVKLKTRQPAMSKSLVEFGVASIEMRIETEQVPVEDILGSKWCHSVYQRLEIKFSNVLNSQAYGIFFKMGLETS